MATAERISPRRAAAARLLTSVRPFALAATTVGVAAAIAPILQRLPHANLSLLFMTSVLIVAVQHGLWPSLFASLLSFLVYNFFFTTPLYTLKVSEEGDVATLLFFLVMAFLSGNLAARLRVALRTRETATRHSESLQDLTRKVAGAASGQQVLDILVATLSRNHACGAVAAVATGHTQVAAKALHDDGNRPDTAKLLDGNSDVPGWCFLPVTTARGRVGGVGLAREALNREELAHAAALVEQASVALERTMLVEDLEAEKLVSEREKMRAALLSSVSHDLRTPLSSIIGSASSLAAYDSALPPAARRELLQATIDEAERLDRYIQNLLDMTRIEQGQLETAADWEDLRDLLSAAMRRLHLADRDLHVERAIDAGAELIHVNGDLVEQALVNVLDNAARFSPPGGRIRVTAGRSGELLTIEVTDEGPGIADADLEKVFDPFYRAAPGLQGGGTGLGLAICRGIARAHGGDATAHANPGGHGARLRLTLRQSRELPAGVSDD